MEEDDYNMDDDSDGDDFLGHGARNDSDSDEDDGDDDAYAQGVCPLVRLNLIVQASFWMLLS
jgi:hypothetical protein